jgi:hypothetical protein
MDPINEAYQQSINEDKFKNVEKEVMKKPWGEDIDFADRMVQRGLATRNPDGVGITFYKANSTDGYFTWGKTKADATKNLKALLASLD